MPCLILWSFKHVWTMLEPKKREWGITVVPAKKSVMYSAEIVPKRINSPRIPQLMYRPSLQNIVPEGMYPLKTSPAFMPEILASSMERHVVRATTSPQ